MIMVVGSVCLSTAQRADAQEQEIEQLILNIEKLLQFKQILSDMKEGYEILSQGYNAVKDISQGNFSIHQVFLDGLLQVSPAVRKYYKVAEIIRMQVLLVKEYKAAFKRFQASQLFNEGELDHLQNVYNQLFKASLQQLDDLAIVVTAGQLRMSDDERIAAIDQIYVSLSGKITFLREFNNQTSVLLLQRLKETNDAKGLEGLYLK